MTLKTNRCRHILLLIILSLFGNSCHTDDSIEEVAQENPQQNFVKFEDYHFMYMHYPSGVMAGNNNGVVQIEYDNQNRPKKRIGGLLPLSGSTGFNYILTTDYTEEITYGNNEILLRVKMPSPYNVDVLRTIFKTENGKITRKIKIDTYTNDTIDYFYNNDRIVNSLHKRIFPVSDTKYYYNSAGNVDSIVSRPFLYNQNTQTWQVDNSSKYRTLQTFKDYDNSPNPTKKLMLFDEIFNRSLSVNNYKSYESRSYDFNGNLGNFSTKTWTFNYINNQIKFTN